MFYHASPHMFSIGDMIEPGHEPNFFEEPVNEVFLSDNLESAEFWEEFLGGESMAEKLGYWQEVFLYLVEPQGELEPDEWCEYYGIKGCFKSTSPLKVVGKFR